MKTCSLVAAAEDLDSIQEIAGFFEGRGWELFSPVIGVGSKTSSAQPQSYLHSSFDLVLVFFSVSFLRNCRRYIPIVERLIQRKQTNLYLVSLDDVWPKGVDSKSILETSYITPEASTLSDFEGGFYDAPPPTYPLLTPRTAKQLLGIIIGNDKAELIDEVRENNTEYDLYRRVDALNDQEDYLLFLYDNSTLRDAAAHFDLNFRKVIGDNPFVVIRSNKINDVSDIQLKNVENIFGAKAVSFRALVAEYAKDYPGSDILLSNPSVCLSEDSIFVDFNCEYEGSGRPEDVLSKLVSTLDDGQFGDYNKLTVILGEGGSGKSWAAKALNRVLLKSGRITTFIDSAIIRSQTFSINELRISNLYDAYKVYQESINANVLDEDVFRLRIFTHPTVIFVDGIEEIKAYLGDRFDLAAFLSDCLQLVQQSAQTKIIISSRFEFWDEVQAQSVSTIKLLPFDDAQINKFFSKHFSRSSSLYRDAKKLVSQLRGINESAVTPAMLNTILEIVERRQEGLDFEDCETDLLNLDQPWDFLIATLLERDKQKLSNDWSIDRWLMILSKFAKVSASGAIALQTFTKLVENEIGRNLLSSEEETLVTHVTLFCDRDTKTISFSNNHYQDFFISLYIKNTIADADYNGFTEEDAFLFNRHILPGSDVSERLRGWLHEEHEFLILSLAELAEKLLTNVTLPKLSEHSRRELVGTLFNLALDLSLVDLSNRRIINSTMSAFFGNESNISNGVFCRLNNTRLSGIRFDFRGMMLINCYFYDFDGLWDCDFDENTNWISCSVEQCSPPVKIPRVKSFGNTEQCTFDAASKLFMSSVKAKKEKSVENVKNELNNFFRVFIRYNNLSNGHDPKELEEEFISILGGKAKSMIDMMIDHGVLEFRAATTKRPVRLLYITPEARDHVQGFLETRQISGGLRGVFNALKA